jgi:regulator of RNase E activity RraA
MQIRLRELTFHVTREASLTVDHTKTAGALSVSVSVGGQVISPGDVVFGDGDGVVSFPFSECARIIAAARARAAYEDDIKCKIAAGDNSWLAPFQTDPS